MENITETIILNILNREQIEKILPHKGDMLFLSRVISQRGSKIIADYDVPYNPFWKDGHFPNNPLMPGVLLAEVANQLAAIFILLRMNEKEKIIVLRGLDKVKFKRQVKPGDKIVVEVDSIENSRILKASFRVKLGNINGPLVCHGEITGAIS